MHVLEAAIHLVDVVDGVVCFGIQAVNIVIHLWRKEIDAFTGCEAVLHICAGITHKAITHK
jgi:hypothetical protein